MWIEMCIETGFCNCAPRHPPFGGCGYIYGMFLPHELCYPEGKWKGEVLFPRESRENSKPDGEEISEDGFWKLGKG